MVNRTILLLALKTQCKIQQNDLFYYIFWFTFYYRHKLECRNLVQGDRQQVRWLWKKILKINAAFCLGITWQIWKNKSEFSFWTDKCLYSVFDMNESVNLVLKLYLSMVTLHNTEFLTRRSWIAKMKK